MKELKKAKTRLNGKKKNGKLSKQNKEALASNHVLLKEKRNLPVNTLLCRGLLLFRKHYFNC